MDQAADAPIYDRAETLRRIGNDEDLFTQMIEFFVEDAPPLLECLDAALDQGDIRGAERAAHSLKGLAANFSAQPAVAVAAQAEAFLREHNLAAARERASLVKEKIGELIRALQNEKRNGE